MGLIESVWHGNGRLAFMARAALWPASRAYGFVAATRSRLYDAGLLGAKAPVLPTVSVGNLSVGGTGKTPVAAWLAARLERTTHVAVVLRGYGSDEAAVHQRINPGIPIVVNPDRGTAIRQAKAAGAEIAVLDDAFQHRRIKRDADILLLSAEQLLRPHRLLPAGPWRESMTAARRADLLIVTRKAASLAEARATMERLGALAPDIPIALVHLSADAMVDTSDESVAPAEALRGASVLAIAAVGEPHVFARQLEQLGARVTLASFRDHHVFSDAEARELARRVPAGGLAVCTLKDAVKLTRWWPGPGRLWYVSQHLVVEQGAEEIDRLLQRVLDARAPATITAG